MTMEKWLKDVSEVLRKQWGLDSSFSSKVSLFYAYLLQYGLNPVITSGFRSPDKQKELIRRWEAGDKSVVVKPAENSQHSITKWGAPASQAIDISTNNPELAARIALAVGIKAGYYFKNPDRVHFYT